MSKLTYTKEQKEELLKNVNVLKFDKKYIQYTKDFKIKAVGQYLNEGMSTRQIFKQAGFNLNVIGIRKPKYLLHDWVKIFREKGVHKLTMETRGRGRGGGRLKTKVNEKLSDKEKINRLELEVEYLKKENDFLVKLRSKRAE